MLDSDQGIWLIDCGLTSAAAGNPVAVYGPIGRRATFDHTETLDERLAETGLDRTAVAGVLLTHLHYDHAGALVDLPSGLPVWVHADELAAAEASGALLGYHPGILNAPVQWRTFRGEISPVAGVRLIETPGHSRGHVSALVDVGRKRLLVTGDAAPTVRNLAERLPPGLQVDGRAAAESLDRLITEWSAGAIALPSHDPEFWAGRGEPVVRFEAA